MIDYARYAMRDHVKESAKDLVSDFFLKLVQGERKWNKRLSFRQSVFGSLRSEVYNYNRKLTGRKPLQEIEEGDAVSLDEDNPLESLADSELKQMALKALKEHKPPPDQIEELLFECKMDGLTTPREIAEFLELDVKEIYKAEKRLERKMVKVRVLFKSMGYE